MSQPHAVSDLPNSSIWPTVIALGKGSSLSDTQLQQLLDWEHSDQTQAMVWHTSSAAVVPSVRARVKLLQAFVQRIESNKAALPLSGAWTDWIVPMWRLWLPLAQRLDSAQRQSERPFIQGIVGGQGTGKTTLTQVLQLILQGMGHQTVCLSIDDLYLSYAERCELRTQDPRLIWRGPPGTHDVPLGIETLTAIQHAKPGVVVNIPQFDKSLHQGQGDRVQPLSVPAPTITLFEGWFVGAQPVADDIFEGENLPAPIATPADVQFAKDCNERLRSYLPLWNLLDSLVVLYPEDYRQSQQWRLDAEEDMKAAGKSGLSRQEVSEFVTYFWKALHPSLYITPLVSSTKTSLVVNICQNHCLGELSSPLAGHADSV